MSAIGNDKVLQHFLDGLEASATQVEERLRTRYEQATQAADRARREAEDTARSTKAELATAREQIVVLTRRTTALSEQLAKAAEATAAAKRETAEAHAASGTARAEAARAADLQRRLDVETRNSAALASELASMKAKPDGMDQHHAAMARLEQTIAKAAATITEAARAAAGPKPTPAAVTPPTYEMQVVARDGNNRATKIRLRPAKE